MSHREKVLAPLDSIHLPLPEKKILERQWLETNISNSAEYAFDFKNAIPSPGKITWILGTELNSVPESMMRMSIYGSMHCKPAELQYIDHSNNSKGRSVYRYDAILEKYSSKDSQFHKAAIAGKVLLESNLAGWKQFANQWGRITKVSYYKKPNHRFAQDNVLMMCMNPRLGVLSEIDQKLNATNRAIISDMDCATLFDLGSRKHFGLNDTLRSVEALRNLLLKTDRVLEQRLVYLNSRSKPICLIRETCFDQQITAALADPTVGIKKALTVAFRALPMWQDVADDLADILKLSPDEYEELANKAVRLDAHTKTHSLYREDVTHDLIGHQAYVARVESYFLSNKNDVLGLFEEVYGERPEHKSESYFVRECASRDYEEHCKDLDFSFPEFAIENIAHIRTDKNTGMSMAY